MPKQTLALICGLVIITFVLFVIALKTSKPVPQMPGEASISITPVQSGGSVEDQNRGMTGEAVKNSMLDLAPNPIAVAPGQDGAVDVNLDASNNAVTAVQLEIAYDPNFISNIQVVPAGLFINPVVLINKNNIGEGRYTFAFGIAPNNDPIQTNGTVATIKFRALNKPGGRTQLGLLPTTLVTARGISDSVLKTAQGALVEISGR